jgi:hypothetical protein
MTSKSNQMVTHNSESTSKLLEAILNDTDKLISAFPKEIKRFDILPVSMFFTMIDIAMDINHLVKKNRYLSVPSLVRNFMDAYVDLILVTSDSKNVYPLLFKVYSDQQKALEARVNPLHSSMFINDDPEAINKQIAERKNELNELKDLIGSNKLRTIKDKYKRVNLLWFYETIYSDLCSQTHNGLDSIVRRHLNPQTEDRILIRYLQAYDTQDYYMYILTLLSYFNESIIVINERLNLKCDLLIKEIRHRSLEFIDRK